MARARCRCRPRRCTRVSDARVPRPHGTEDEARLLGFLRVDHAAAVDQHRASERRFQAGKIEPTVSVMGNHHHGRIGAARRLPEVGRGACTHPDRAKATLRRVRVKYDASVVLGLFCVTAVREVRAAEDHDLRPGQGEPRFGRASSTSLATCRGMASLTARAAWRTRLDVRKALYEEPGSLGMQ